MRREILARVHAALPRVPIDEIAELHPLQADRLLSAVHRGWTVGKVGRVWCLSKPDGGRHEIRVTAEGLTGISPQDFT